MAASQDLSSYFALIASKMIPPPLPLLLLRSALLNKLHLSESSSDIKKNLDNEKSALKSKKKHITGVWRDKKWSKRTFAEGKFARYDPTKHNKSN